MSPQTVDRQKIFKVSDFLKLSKHAFLSSANGLVHQVKLDPDHSRWLVLNLTTETGQERDHDYHFKVLFIFHCPKYPFNNLIADLIFYWNEELVLNVNEMLGVLN